LSVGKIGVEANFGEMVLEIIHLSWIECIHNWFEILSVLRRFKRTRLLAIVPLRLWSVPCSYPAHDLSAMVCLITEAFMSSFTCLIGLCATLLVLKKNTQVAQLMHARRLSALVQRISAHGGAAPAQLTQAGPISMWWLILRVSVDLTVNYPHPSIQ
jgi:hypothetical protein